MNWPDSFAGHLFCTGALTVVVAQRLVKRLCEACRKSAKPSPVDVAWFESFSLKVPAKIWRSVGCKECKQLGYCGRTGTFEVWRLTEDDRQTILSAGNEPELRKQLADRKHHFLLDDALVKLKEGATSLEEVKCIAGGIRSRPRSQRA
jgi:type II secretory ATPase GspE/PulE/Tfp pilus assembly ATPase PilB-like protein